MSTLKVLKNNCRNIVKFYLRFYLIVTNVKEDHNIVIKNVFWYGQQAVIFAREKHENYFPHDKL